MSEEMKLRRLLALTYSGTSLYGDDGELQDTKVQPFIDFKRDSADEIEDKIQERALDAHMGLGKTRGYLQGANNLNKICIWE